MRILLLGATGSAGGSVLRACLASPRVSSVRAIARREPRRYKLLRPILRVVLGPFRSLYVKGDDIGRAMLFAAGEGLRARVIANREIRDLADRSRAL